MKEQPKTPKTLTPIFLVLGIPATGKSTIFSAIKNNSKQLNIHVEIVSSDEIRNAKMEELMGREGVGKREAYLRVKEEAEGEYWGRLGDLVTEIGKMEGGGNHAIFMDKNYYSQTLKPAITNIHNLQKISSKYTNTSIKLIAILPKCLQFLTLPPSHHYPFSLSFIACCLKRVVSRSKHPTLEGSQAYRVSVGLGWANNFRDFEIGEEEFDGLVEIPFTKEQPVPEEIGECIKKILMESEVGKYDEHQDTQRLIQLLKQWNNQQIVVEQKMEQVHKILENLFTQLRVTMDD